MPDPTAHHPKNHKHRQSGNRPKRVGMIAGTFLVAVVLGALISYSFGTGFRPAPAKAIADRQTEQSMSMGRIETLRLPLKARRLSDIRTFDVEMKSADDYGRVFVNNVLFLNTDDPDLLFYTHDDPEVSRALTKKFAVDRYDLMVGKRDARPLLRSGIKNYIVVELENSILGPCVTSVDMFVNGEELETFPRTLPEAWNVEPEVMNSDLLKKMKALERNPAKGFTDEERKKYSVSERSELSVTSLEDAICARRVFEFFLE
jgi:hypothetical protein